MSAAAAAELRTAGRVGTSVIRKRPCAMARALVCCSAALEMGTVSQPCKWRNATPRHRLHAFGAVVEAGDVVESLAAGRQEGRRAPRWQISSSVSRQSAAKPGQITSTPSGAALGQRLERGLGVGLQPFGAAEAALERDAPVSRPPAAASRPAGGPSSGIRSGTDRPAAACAWACRGSSSPACGRGPRAASACAPGRLTRASM